MGTANFRIINTNNYYVIDTDDVYDFDDIIDCTDITAEQLGLSKYDKPLYDHRRDCTTYYYKEGEWQSKHSNDITAIRINTDIMMLSGYYTGATVDYELTIDTMIDQYRLSDYKTVEDLIADIIDDLKWYYSTHSNGDGWNTGTVELIRRTYSKWIEDIIDKAKAEADDMCSKIADMELSCEGTFSNGEALYTVVSTNTEMDIYK